MIGNVVCRRASRGFSGEMRGVGHVIDVKRGRERERGIS